MSVDRAHETAESLRGAVASRQPPVSNNWDRRALHSNLELGTSCSSITCQYCPRRIKAALCRRARNPREVPNPPSPYNYRTDRGQALSTAVAQLSKSVQGGSVHLKNPENIEHVFSTLFTGTLHIGFDVDATTRDYVLVSFY